MHSTNPRYGQRKGQGWLVILFICILNLSISATPSIASDFFNGFNFRSGGYPGNRGQSGPRDTEV